MPENQSASLHLVKPENTCIPTELLNACEIAMDQALGIEKTSLTALSEWNAQAMEIAWSFAPVLCDIYGLAMRTLAGCWQWNRYLLALPCAHAGSGLQLSGEVTGTVVSEAEMPAVETLALSMDVATGTESVADEIEILSIAPVVKISEEPMQPASQTEQAEEEEATVANVA